MILSSLVVCVYVLDDENGLYQIRLMSTSDSVIEDVVLNLGVLNLALLHVLLWRSQDFRLSYKSVSQAPILQAPRN